MNLIKNLLTQNKSRNSRFNQKHLFRCTNFDFGTEDVKEHSGGYQVFSTIKILVQWGCLTEVFIRYLYDGAMVGGLTSRVSGGDGPQDVDGGPHRGVEGGRVLQLDPQVQPSRQKRGHLSISPPGTCPTNCLSSMWTWWGWWRLLWGERSIETF